MKKEIESIIRQIADLLMVNGSFLLNPGLFYGDMGLVLFFTRYARYTQNELYLDYSYDLMGKIQKSINRESPINYVNGLAGIGSAIEYLVQNGFFAANTDEILEDIDRQVFFTYNLLNLSIDKIMDIGYYAAWRMSGNSTQKDAIQRTILPQIEKIMHDHSVVPAWHQLCRKTISDSFAGKTYSHCLELIAKNNFWGNEIGFQNGLAGWGLSLLTELDGDDSWISLLISED